jgi:Holliday junction DNA helicase RuvA
MIAFIEGKVTAIAPTHVILSSGGIGYHLHISLQTYSAIRGQSHCRLFAYLHIGGSLQGPISLSLYGFHEEAEREMFLHLLSISGVGAATVRMILSSMNVNEIQQAVVTENSLSLEQVKGIGKKTAQRIILEMKDKIGKGIRLSTEAVTPGNNAREEALTALVMLGFSRTQSEQAVNKVQASGEPELSVEELIKRSLKHI